ncbi:MAG TPA: SDR family oxidoreductase [Ohtaekwangia sp.]|uniref:SDR family NAD(P)-dependent oxidoreductase n=1 Tax=Ohtaekwangia sp. TaxID=2066019 RepID=UPI002F93475B
MQTTNKIALVTGGSRGLGKNAAVSLAKKGLDVILTYNSKKAEAEATVAEITALGQKAIALQLNTAQVAEFDPFAKQLASVLKEQWNRTSFDYLVNNAGIDWAAPFVQTTEEQFDALFNVHFKGVYFLTQKLLPLVADKGGIINLSTGLARFATPGYSAYASMKGAIEVFTRYLAKELGVRGIRANAVAPGAIETDFTKNAFDAHPEAKDFIASQTALGRVGQADDIGGVVAFLCTEDARWINAQRIEASGGMFL